MVGICGQCPLRNRGLGAEFGAVGAKGWSFVAKNGGKGGYSKSRWELWKSRFMWIEEESEADDVAKTLGAKAVGRMEEIEKARG